MNIQEAITIKTLCSHYAPIKSCLITEKADDVFVCNIVARSTNIESSCIHDHNSKSFIIALVFVNTFTKYDETEAA